MKSKTSILLTANSINFAIGLVNILFWLKGENDFFFFVFGANLVVHFLVNRDPVQTLVALLTYPLGLITFTKILNVRFPEEGQNEKFFVFRKKNVNILHPKAVCYFGSPEEKKRLILQLVDDLKKGKVKVDKIVPFLKKLVLDPHPDVVLYASESIGEIESFFGESTNTPLMIEELNNAVEDYLKSDFWSGEKRRRYKEFLIKKIETLGKTPEYFVLKYKVQGDVSVLFEGLKETKSREILGLLLVELVKNKEYEKFRSLKKFLSSGD
ncbi:hypothetical protein [Thermotoga sp. KOL6]|uniref:hypothetical protein n=1 Tax=Thermotoga sp. KOL6 TaxID=126741 RepID=UPI000C77A1F7|nr:hypothetical protein [Thermotoga sp. KOL6]PLV60332.1 hypothetical protein AS005_03365 [Thermotoga sp. KOL6]